MKPASVSFRGSMMRGWRRRARRSPYAQIQFASRLLSCALAAGLVGGKRDPRAAIAPRVPDDALAYVLHVLRAVRFSGSFVKNPYLASLGLAGGDLADRLRALCAPWFAPDRTCSRGPAGSRVDQSIRERSHDPSGSR